MGNQPTLLTFDLLDDLAPVPPDRFGQLSSHLREADSVTLGPLVEYYYLRQTLPHLPSLDALKHGRVIDAFVARTEVKPVSSRAFDVEFKRCPTTDNETITPEHESFLRRVTAAAESAGFLRSTALALSAAVVEMIDNVPRHSDKAASGLVGYRWSPREFEFVVADSGIGVLASLRKCTDYVSLQEHGAALMTALQDGESRFGHNSGKGFGFRTVFTALASLQAYLRFRSGDSCLTLEGVSPDISAGVSLAQGADYQGFMASVVCRV